MRRHFSILFVFILCLVTLTSAITPTDNGTWIATGTLLAARQDAAAIALPDGRVLVTGGRAADGSVLASSEIIQANGTAVAGPTMSAPRAGHTATLLQTGSVLIVGGDSGAGATVTAELFDPDTNVFTPLSATLNDARMGHVAALDAYGNVTIIGGATANGPVLSVESFNVTSRRFFDVGRLMYSRSRAAIAAFSDGRILIAGGIDSNGTTLASTEIFDPTTGASAAGPTMNVARAGASATLQDDGNIIVIGGTAPSEAQNDSIELVSGELIAAEGSSSFLASVLNVARAGHTALLLPDNNGVLVIGGQASGADLNSAELYMPWTGTATLSNLATTHTAAASAAKSGVMTVAGGANQTGVEQFGFATLITNQKDYAPGEPVIMGGSGWQPGEYVTLSMTQNPQVDGNITQQVQADTTGDIIGFDYAPTSADLNTAYVLTAVGSKSQAQVRFTDAFSSVSCSPSTLTIGSQTTCTATGSGNSENGHVVTWAVTTGTGTFSPTNTCTISGSTCIITYTPSSVGTQTIRGTISGTNRTTTLTVNKGTPTVSWSTAPPASAAYNSSFNVVATRNSTGAITYVTSGGCSNIGGTITMTSGTTACQVSANVAADSNYNAGSVGPTSVTANKATPTVSWSTAPPASAAYNGSFNVVATSNSSGAITYATSGGCSNTGGTVTMTSSTTACSVTANAAADANYSAGSVGPTSVTATKATPTVNTWPTASGITYGQALSALTLTGGSASVTGTFAFTPDTTIPNAGTYHAPVTFTPTDANYAAASGTVDVAVAKAPPALTWTPPPTITYGTALSSTQLNATVNGGLEGTLVYTPAAGEVLNAGPHTLNVLFTPADTTNYSTANASVSLTVNKVTPTIAWTAPTAITYGTALSATQLNATVNGGLAGTLVYTPAAGEVLNAGPHTLNVLFTPADTTNYETANASVSVTVNKATTSLVWTGPTAITYGTALDASQLNATVNGGVAGTLVYTPAAGEVLNAGPHTLSVAFTPSDTTNYEAANASVSLTVNKATPAVSAWPAATGITYGQALFASTLNGGNASVNGGFAFTSTTTKPNAGVAQADVIFTPTDAANYNTTSGTVEVSVAKANPSVTAWPTGSTITYGQQLSASTLAGGVSSPVGTFSFSDPTARLSAGTHGVAVTFTPADADNYNALAGIANVLVEKAQPSITWATPAAINYGMPLSVAQLNASASVAGNYTYSPALNAILSSGIQTLSVTFTPSDSNYNSVNASVQIVVNKLTPTITWPTPAPIASTTALSSTQLNATADVPGRFTYTPSGGMRLSVGTQQLSVLFTPTDTTNYTIATATVNIVVLVSGIDLYEKNVNVTGDFSGGGAITVADTTVNQGSANAPSSATFFYVSLDGVTKGSYIGSRTVVSLAGNTDSGPVSTALTLPSNLRGNYYVIACANGNSAVADKNSANNCSASNMFTVAAPDLVESGVTVPTTVGSGSPFSVTDTTTNQGLGSAPTSSTFFYLSLDGVTKGTSLGSRTVVNLAAGASTTVSTTFTMPTNTRGTYYIIACANGNSGVLETSTTNDCAVSGSFSVSGPDLTEGNVSVSGTLGAGMPFTVTDTTSNQGVGAAPSSVTFFYLSLDGVTKGSSLGSKSVAILAGGANTGAVSTTLTMPYNVRGNYYVIACANGNSGVVETSTTNNCASSSMITVAGADLVENNVSATGSFVAGSSITVSDSTINQGGGAAATSVTYFYLSVDGLSKGTTIGLRSVGTLNANANSGLVNTTLTLPASMTGAYYVLACANATSTVSETSTANNCSASTQITITK